MKKRLPLLFFFLPLLGFAIYLSKDDTEVKSQTQSRLVDNAFANKKKEYDKKYALKELAENQGDILGLDAPSAIIISEDGEIIYEKDPHLHRPPASIIKVLTGAVALENIDMNKKIVVSKFAAETEPNKIVLKEGEKLKAEDLMYALMMISANDAAEVLADGIDGKRETFLNKMREKVSLLDLKDTNVRNPNGLDDPEQYSSAYDIGKIAYYAIKTRPDIIKYLGYDEAYSVFPTEENESHWWGGHISSALSAYPEMLGAKTGFTYEAGNTFVGIAQKGEKKFVFVFMGSDNGNSDAQKLLYHGLEKIN